MDLALIAVLAIGALFIVGGPIVGYFASKASEKAEDLEKGQGTNPKNGRM